MSTTTSVSTTVKAHVAPIPDDLSSIARIITNDWKNVNYAARPYLNAMFSLTDMNSQYGYDSARNVVLHFLSNAASWKGDVAREVKKKLNQLLKK